jgi:hypothetical protein
MSLQTTVGALPHATILSSGAIRNMLHPEVSRDEDEYVATNANSKRDWSSDESCDNVLMVKRTPLPDQPTEYRA